MENSLIISLIVLFLHATTWEGMIFNAVKNVISPDKGWLYKPIYGCPICMTPWWGTLIYLIFFPFTWQGWLLTVGGAAGLSVIWVVLVTIRDYCLENSK